MTGKQPPEVDLIKDVDRDTVDYNDLFWLAFLLLPVMLAGAILGFVKWFAEKIGYYRNE